MHRRAVAADGGNPNVLGAEPSVCMLVQRSLEHDSRVRREAIALGRAGYRVTVLEFAPTGTALEGVERRAVLSPWTQRLLPLRLRQALMIGAFLASVARLRPDVVHAHDLLMLLPGLLGARLVGARLVYDTHELATGVAYRQGAIKRVADAIEALGIRRAALVLTPSGAIADRLGELYGLRRGAVVVRNVCALRRPGRDDPPGGLRRRLGLARQPLVLHQGAAAPQRGCETLVGAMALVPDAHLAFLGTCERGFDARLREVAAGAGVEGRVHFVPNAPLDELLAHTREADVGVSLFEPACENYRLTLPNKLFEYVAAGVPVVASAVPEVERIVREHGIGWTVDPTSEQDVAAALQRALRQRADLSMQERLGAADAALSWSRERKVLLDAYRGLTAMSATTSR